MTKRIKDCTWEELHEFLLNALNGFNKSEHFEDLVSECMVNLCEWKVDAPHLPMNKVEMMVRDIAKFYIRHNRSPVVVPLKKDYSPTTTDRKKELLDTIVNMGRVTFEEEKHDQIAEESNENYQSDIDKVSDIVQSLPKSHQNIILMNYVDDMSLSEISRVMGVSRQAVNQIHRRILDNIRGKLGVKIEES